MTYIAVDGVSAILDIDSAITGQVARSGAASFLYLEVLDASFSFDGVIGAFALSNNLFIIAIGLGIGAMFVRSLTIMLVEKEALASYRYLEHGAFYAIIALGGDDVSQCRHPYPGSGHRTDRQRLYRLGVLRLDPLQPPRSAVRDCLFIHLQALS